MLKGTKVSNIVAASSFRDDKSIVLVFPQALQYNTLLYTILFQTLQKINHLISSPRGIFLLLFVSCTHSTFDRSIMVGILHYSTFNLYQVLDSNLP